MYCMFILYITIDLTKISWPCCMYMYVYIPGIQRDADVLYKVMSPPLVLFYYTDKSFVLISSSSSLLPCPLLCTFGMCIQLLIPILFETIKWVFQLVNCLFQFHEYHVLAGSQNAWPHYCFHRQQVKPHHQHQM